MTAEGTLYDLFAASVAAHGDEIALEVAGSALTYRELAALAGEIAAQVLARTEGVVPQRIGLVAERRVSSYAGYLAIQRLGATVVPLNPSFPPGRNAAIARAGQLELILSETTDLRIGVPVLNTGERPGAGLPPLPPRPADVHRPAYLLFTSGSTGTPKGVPVPHTCVSAYVRHVVPRYEIGPGARLSQTFELTFDPSVFDMFAAWSSGATLVVPDHDEVLTPVRFVTAHAITHWFSVPSVISFAKRLRALPAGSMPSLRWSLFAGEALTLEQARAWHRAAPHSVLDNTYGPTELTVTCTEFRLPADEADWPVTANGTVPIGRVYPGLEHLVLDEDGRPAGEGELCVRGPQRFPGYADPADNIGRFHRFENGQAIGYDGSEPLTDRHWYRTGDRVSLLDGVLVHQGRLDHQVKIRGFRIELGEIEGALRAQEGVLDAVVIAVPGPDGEVDLEAVYTGAEQHPGELAQALGRRLAPYMVPRRFVRLEALPLNPNGKVDRAALAAR